MTVKEFQQVKRLICQELNIHKLIIRVAKTEKGELTICVTDNLGFGDAPSEIFLELAGHRIDKPRLLEKVVKIITRRVNYDQQ